MPFFPVFASILTDAIQDFFNMKEKQVPERTKMRPSDFFFGDGTDDFGDGNDWRSPESPMAPMLVFNRSPIIPDRLERDLQVFEECITDRPTDGRTDGPTDRRTDGRTKPHIEMRGRI